MNNKLKIALYDLQDNLYEFLEVHCREYQKTDGETDEDLEEISKLAGELEADLSAFLKERQY